MTTEPTIEQEYAKFKRVHELMLTPSQLKLIKRVTLLADDGNNAWRGWTQGTDAVDGNRFRFNSADTHALASEVTGNPYYYQRHDNEKRAGCNLLAKMMLACGWDWPNDVAIWSAYSHDRVLRRAADRAYRKAGGDTPAKADATGYAAEAVGGAHTITARVKDDGQVVGDSMKDWRDGCWEHGLDEHECWRGFKECECSCDFPDDCPPISKKTPAELTEAYEHVGREARAAQCTYIEGLAIAINRLVGFETPLGYAGTYSYEERDAAAKRLIELIEDVEAKTAEIGKAFEWLRQDFEGRVGY